MNTPILMAWLQSLVAAGTDAVGAIVARLESLPGFGFSETMAGTLRTVLGGRPLVSIHDSASHGLAWLGSAMGVAQVALGVDEFGQSGTIADLYAAQDLDAGSIVNAALAVLSLP